MDFGTGDWTVECWINQTKAFSDYQTIWSKYVSNAGYYLLTTSTGAILLGVSNVTSVTSTAKISLNTWYHLTIARSSNVLYVWLNGVQITQYATTASNLDNSTAGFLLGILMGSLGILVDTFLILE